MFDEKEEKFYQNEDYAVRIKKIDGIERYFIKFRSQVTSAEIEIGFDDFNLYLKEFNKPLERQRNERKRHIEDGEIEYFIASGKLTIYTIEDDDKLAVKCTIDTILKKCTPIQQRRYEQHYIQGYSFTEIAKIENCDEAAIRRSISAVLKKIKKYFQG